ncbi:MAG: hypothetical protein ACOCUU_01405 [Nanoarchaeota archaeon]
MAKKSKVSTPEWILEGYDSKEDYEKSKGITKKKKKGKTFKIKECPKCKSDKVSIVVGNKEGKEAKTWECKKCDWKGEDIKEKELNEDEFMKYLDEKGEPLI